MAPPIKRSLITRFISNNYVAGALPTLGGLMFGCDISSMSGQLSNPYYLDQFNYPNSSLQGGITAAMPAGSFAGALINSWLADKLGRKRTIIVGSWIWVIGCVIQAAASNVATLIAGRVVAGIAVGILSAIVTTYQAELTKPSIRGRIVAIQQLSIMSGIFLQYFVQLGASYVNSDASFRLPWGLQGIPGLVLGTLMWIFPESPRWLCDRGRSEEALQILADVHAAGDTEDHLVRLEFAEIMQAIEFDKTQAARSYADLFHVSVRRRVFLGMSEQMWSQLTGMNVMMYYVIYVFQSAGIQGREGELIASSVQYALGVAFTIPAVIYIDRWGRRPMLLYGALVMGMWLFLVGGLQAGFGHAVENAAADATTTWVVEGNRGATYAIIVCSYLFVSSFAISWGPCSWTYAAEIFPTRVRAKAISMSTASNWAFNFALAFATPPAFRNIQWRTYFVFGSFCFAMAIHVFFMFPETRGRTLEEMEEVFDGNAFTAWRVSSSKGKKTLEDVEAAEVATTHEASLIPILSLVFLLFAAFYHLGEARNFTVGGSVPGWKVPDPANNTLKNWAEGRRFIVGDTLVFHYDNKTNDSVLEVTEENYKNCITEKPVNEYKGEPAMVTLSVSGPHYFISGAPGNCQKDEKLIVAVQSTQHPPIPKPNAPTVPTPSKSPTTVTAPAPAPSTAVGLVAGSGIFWAIVAIIGFAWA